MKIHEFQAKEILRKAGVPVPRGIVARTADEAAAAFANWAADRPSSKPRSMPADAARERSRPTPASTACSWSKAPTRPPRSPAPCLGQSLVTIQTGPEGQTVRQVLVEEGCDIARELYLGIVVDRAAAGPVLMVSTKGA